MSASTVLTISKAKDFKTKKLKCYFAHPYDKRKTIGKYKIRKILLERGVVITDPFIKEFQILRKYGIKKEYYMNPIFKAGKEMWIKDLSQIDHCDMIVAWMPESSIGVSAEIQHAYRRFKFIQIISPLRHPSFAYVLTGPNQQFESIKDFDRLREMEWGD